MKKKIKIKISEIPTYHSYVSGSADGVKGYFYHLSEALSEAEKERINDKHNNVLFFKSKKQFAPELGADVLFVSEKVLK